MNSARIGGSRFQQRLAELQVVDGARRGGTGGFAHGVVVQIERRGGGQQRAAAVAAIGAGDAGQQRHGAQVLAAMGEAAHAEADADERRARGAVHRGQAFDVGGGQAGDLGDAVGCEARQHLAAPPGRSRACGPPGRRGRRGRRATRMCITPSARAELVPIRIGRYQSAACGGAGAARIDHDQLDAAFADLLDLRPEMHVGGVQVGSPADDQVGFRRRIPGRRRRSGRRSHPRRPRRRNCRPCRRSSRLAPSA